jgi:hypothetical protein
MIKLVTRQGSDLPKAAGSGRSPDTVNPSGITTAGDNVAGQWPEGFRFDPNARWDDEIKRLSEAANADVVFGLTEKQHECATGCSQQVTRTVTVSTPDKTTSTSLDLCEKHYQAALNDRTNAKHGLDPQHEFSNERLGGDAEQVHRLESVITNPDLRWQSFDLADPSRKIEPPRQEGIYYAY